ncbi:MAG: SDR family oxidoreductase [Synechococcus sp. BS301-5m-G54]|nr:SDR family oxidoreductase [Synechococcus sp. BS301-5m-G54]MBL6795176.1 SDR family oxidoreductase [Synechococcus sp. BS307-5m-G34]
MLNELVNRSRALPASAKVLILGGGYSGRMLAALLRRLGNTVLCTRRDQSRPDADLLFDSDRDLLPQPDALQGITHLLSTIPPSPEGQDPALHCLRSKLESMPLQWVGYLSTTGVYGDTQGNWVRETDPARPGQARSRRRLNCEEAWRDSGLPIQILRLPGIYGPGRSVLNTVQEGRARRIDKTGQVFCRVHVEDIAGACLHLMHRSQEGVHPAIVNVVDDEPAASTELLDHACALLGRSAPETETFEQASLQMSAMARSFWSENRRVSNDLLRDGLGYDLLHPDYRVGLQDCLKQDVSPSSPA